MTDPKFETRAELEAWINHVPVFFTVEAVVLWQEKVKRMKIAHSHLIGEK